MPETRHPEQRGAPSRTTADFLIGPSAAVAESADQQKARLAAALALAMAILATLGFVITGLQQGDWGATLQSFGPILIASYLSYVLTRTRLHTVGALIFVLLLCAAPFLAILSVGRQDVGSSLLIFLPLGLILGSFLLSPRVMAVVLVLVVGAFLALPWAGIKLASGDWAALASTVTIGVVLIVFTSFRYRTERANVEILGRTNSELESMRHGLEARIMERTEALNRRTAQLEAVSFVSRQTAAILDPTRLLDEVVQLISDRFGFYHAGVFLLDIRGQFAVLQSASSEGGRIMLARGHRLEVGREGIVGYAAYEKRARIALDVGEEAVYFSNPDLPDTRSEMALPLIVRGRVIGVMDIQATEPQAFTEDDISALQSLADQIALALDNARLLAESQASLKQLQSLTSESSYRAWQERAKARRTAFRYTPLGITPIRQDDNDGETAGATAGIDPSSLRVPISLRGKEIGALVIQRKGRGQEWSENDLNLVTDISTQVALALDNARLLEDLQQRANREQAIAQAASRFSQTTDIDTLLQLALREFHQLPSVEEVAVVIKQTEEGRPTE